MANPIKKRLADLLDQDLFMPRELSWLTFNARVLQEAADETVPVIERLRYLGIFSNNSDEFFRVRVAEVRRLISVSSGDHKQQSKDLLAADGLGIDHHQAGIDGLGGNRRRRHCDGPQAQRAGCLPGGASRALHDGGAERGVLRGAARRAGAAPHPLHAEFGRLAPARRSGVGKVGGAHGECVYATGDGRL